MNKLAAARLKVLVADDDPIARRLVVGSLRSRFEVFEAADGAEALALFVEHEPDLVLLDVDMPKKTGVEAAEEMRAMAANRYLPILLISGLDQVTTLVEGLARGADDFLPKPFNSRVFESKLKVILRIRDMQSRLREQMQQLEVFRLQTEEEHALAHEVFARLLERGAVNDPRVRFSASPLAMFNGDVILTANRPNGGFRWMLADVAGHGLSGAMGTVPLSIQFFQLTQGGATLDYTLRQINGELRASLPSRLFCAAAMLELDASRSVLTVCNAGMPSVQLRRASGELCSFGSKNFPLAIASEFDPQVDHIEVTAGDRIFIASDGIIEAPNASGEMFGVERFCSVLASSTPEQAFDGVLDSLAKFSSGVQADDVSLLEVVV